MADTITVTYKVNEDGSLTKIAKGADKAAKATDKATTSSDRYSKKQKGVANATSNSTKSFSKMSQGMTSGLVPAYATLAANVFALSAAFGVLSRNDAIGKLEEGLEFTGRAAGRNLGLVARGLQEITDNAISAEQAMRTTAVGISAGFSQSQMEGLAKVAKGAAMALGRDLGDAMDRLTRGAAKLEPEILDELGIMVRLDDAVNDYALAMNKGVKELTQFERRQAFTNAIIADGVAKFSALSDALDPSAYAQLSATFSDLTKTVIGGFNTAVGPFLRFLADTPLALGALAAAFTASMATTIVGGLEGMAESSAEAAKRTDAQSKAATKAIQPNSKLAKGFNKLAASEDRSNKALREMTVSLDRTIRTTKKDLEKKAEAIAQRKVITAEIHRQNMAQAKMNATTALGTLQEVGLTAGIKAHTVAMAEMARSASVAASAQGVLAGSLTLVTTAVSITTASVRFLGAAFLTIMPYIAIAMAAFSILGPMVMRLFGGKDNLLSKQLEENTERFKEFDNVLSQYNRTIIHSKNANEIWINSLSPLSGMLAETATGLEDLMAAAEADRLIALSNAMDKVAASEKRIATPSKVYGGLAGAGAQFGESTGAARALKTAKAEVKANAELSEKTMQLLAREADAYVIKMGLSLVSMSEKATQVGEKLGLSATASTAAILVQSDAITKAVEAWDNSEKGIEAYKALTGAVKAAADASLAAVDAFKSFGENVKRAKELMGDPKTTWGAYASELDNIAESVNKLNTIGKAGGLTTQQAKDLLLAYGIELKPGEDGIKRLETLKSAMTDVADKSKANALAQAQLDTAMSLGTLSRVNAEKAITLAKERTAIIAKELSDITIKGTQAELDKQLELNAAKQEEINLILKKFESLGKAAADSGMGAGAAAAIAGQGAISAAGSDEEKSDARNLAAKATLAGVATDLAAIGPEGALMSSAIEGALNIQTAFSTAFEVMGDKSADMSTKVQAGLGAAAGMISSLGAISKANSDAKVKGLDDEIAAEKRRDGTSAASTAKIKALEAKKLATQKKAFETNKKMKMAQTVISTAMGAMAAYSSAMESIPAPYNIPVAIGMAGMVAAMGAKQLSMIASTSFSGGGGSAGAAPAPSAISVGSRKSSVDLAKTQSASGELGYMRGESGIGGAENFRPAFSGYKHRAGGGYVVGEQGPELFMPETPGTIIPSGQGAGGSTNVNFSIQAVDADGVEDLLVRQRGNIIGMIREAANSYGQDFMEGIDTSIYTPSSAGATKY